MKKQIFVALAAGVFAAFLISGCGGGGGASVIVQPKNGGKLCVPQDSWRSSAATTSSIEEYRTLQGVIDYSSIEDGEILMSFSENVPEPASGTRASAKVKEMYRALQQKAAAQYASDTMYFYAEGTGVGSAECGNYFFFAYGTVDSAGQLIVSQDTLSDAINSGTFYVYSYGYDSCGELSVEFTGTRGANGADGTVTLTGGATAARASSQTATTPYSYAGTWSAADLNCIRISQNGEVTPNTVTVESGGQVNFDPLLYDLSCHEVDPVSYTSGGQTYEMTYWVSGSEAYNSDYGEYYISSNNNIGTIDPNTGVLTATETTTTISGDLYLFYGGLFDKITITVSPNTSAVVAANITAAKSYLFKPTVTSTDFANAKTEINAALAADADNPDANLLKAIIDLGTEVERWDYEVEYTPETNFPYNVSYRMAAKMMTDAVKPVVDFVTGPYPKQVVRFSSEDPENSEVQTEIETNTLPVINGIVTALEYVKSYVDSHPTWTFAYPKDVANPTLGDNYIDATDVKALLGAMYMVKSLTNFGLAYQCDYDENTWDMTDLNSDGKYDASEQFPNSACGTLRTNGASYLSTAQTYMASGLSMLDTAVTAILAEVAPAIGGEAIESDDIADARHYQYFLTELAASFGGTATSITFPETAECYYTASYGYGGSYTAKDVIFDPDNNTDETAKCDSLITRNPEITASVKFSGLFSPAITDWRNLTPNLVVYEDEDTAVVESSGGELVLPDSTLNGMFPGGVQASWFNETTANYSIKVALFDSSGNPIDCQSFYSGVTLTIGSKTLTAYSCYWGEGAYNRLAFYNLAMQTTIPTSADTITVNTVTGTQATLSGVTGCVSKTLLLTGVNAFAKATLSGTSCVGAGGI